MDRLLDLLAHQPEYRFFLDGQINPVKDYLEIRPERTGDLHPLGLLAILFYQQPTI
jgi:mannosylglycerate hydrolase